MCASAQKEAKKITAHKTSTFFFNLNLFWKPKRWKKNIHPHSQVCNFVDCTGTFSKRRWVLDKTYGMDKNEIRREKKIFQSGALLIPFYSIGIQLRQDKIRIRISCNVYGSNAKFQCRSTDIIVYRINPIQMWWLLVSCNRCEFFRLGFSLFMPFNYHSKRKWLQWHAWLCRYIYIFFSRFSSLIFALNLCAVFFFNINLSMAMIWAIVLAQCLRIINVSAMMCFDLCSFLFLSSISLCADTVRIANSKSIVSMYFIRQLHTH